MSGSASDNKKERKAVTLGDGSGMEARSTQWLPPLSVARIPDCEKSSVVFMYLNEKIMMEATSHGITPETEYSDLKEKLINQLRVDINHFERRVELSRASQGTRENIESYGARLLTLSKQAFPTTTQIAQTQMAKDQLIRGVNNNKICELLVRAEETPFDELLKLTRQEEKVQDRMRSAACDAAVSILDRQLNTETQPARTSESRSTAATDRIAAALEEEEEESFDALALRADSEQDIEKLVCEFRRLLTRSVRLRGRLANHPPEQLSDAACWNCGRGGHYRRSCPLANAQRPRRSPNRETNRVRTLFIKTQGVVLSVNTKWAAELPGKVNGRSVRFLVDTGAAVSVIRESEVNMVGNVRTNRHGSRQIVAANGECLEIVGTAELDIKLGDKFLARHSMIVARNLSHPCLLGTDFLRPRKALIDLGDGRIKLDRIWLNLESLHTPNDRNQREAEQECDICLLETVVLPVIVTGKSNANWTTKDGFFEPAPKLVTNHSVMAACSLSRTHRGTVPVRLLNGTDAPITLFKDTKLGTYSTAYSTASTRKTVKAPNAESRRKYSELIENMAKLSHDVPHTIRRRLRTLLWKYKQIIATDEYNTG
ncbi:Retroviral-like aspartic protease 1 [Trichinella pseudospiralis]|uniref:Retroviral-like aspartic protease 1 n=1 Tax=Trichinella pseudospiralis TaxID=6337 RepID=A0A0V0YG16_TRIPS|nr:Retroviral-like aspartic protease 1 [Trichinella pseudospiralis]